MSKYSIKLFLLIFVCSIGMNGCGRTVYVRQQQQTYHDYKAIKHNKIVNKTRKPRTRN